MANEGQFVICSNASIMKVGRNRGSPAETEDEETVAIFSERLVYVHMAWNGKIKFILTS